MITSTTLKMKVCSSLLDTRESVVVERLQLEEPNFGIQSLKQVERELAMHVQ